MHLICEDTTLYNSYVQTPRIQLIWSDFTYRINMLLSELYKCTNLRTFIRTRQLCHQTPVLDTTNNLPFVIQQVLSLHKILQTLAIRVPQLLVQTHEEIFCAVRTVWWVCPVVCWIYMAKKAGLIVLWQARVNISLTKQQLS
jgi:hypothetical protein